MVCARKSDPDTHAGEHEHWLVNVPRHLQDKALRLVFGWCENAFAEVVTPKGATSGGKARSIVNYVLKAASQVSVARDPTILYRRSGAILGDRVFMTRNIDAKARVDATIGIRAARRICNEKAQIARYQASHLSTARSDHGGNDPDP